VNKKGWIDKAGTKFSMHRMVQTLVKYQERLDEKNTKELVETFSQKLKIDQTKDNPADKFQWIEYGKFIFESRETGSLHDKISALANNLATVVQALGDYQGAKLLLEKVLKSDEANFGETHLATPVRHYNYGVLLDSMNIPYKGFKWCKKAHHIFNNHLATSHPNTQTG
jgi:tetratricopeptide (TPR) repeat protein